MVKLTDRTVSRGEVSTLVNGVWVPMFWCGRETCQERILLHKNENGNGNACKLPEQAILVSITETKELVFCSIRCAVLTLQRIRKDGES